MLHASTYLTVLLAWHRFNASDRPIEYYISWKMVNPNVSALKAIIVGLVAAMILVIPLFFEPKVQYETYMSYKKINATHVLLVKIHFPFRFTISNLSFLSRLFFSSFVCSRNLLS
jgi:hypothetical protein